MWVVAFLSDFPHVTESAGFGGEFECGFSDEVDHFVGGEKVSGVEVKSPLAFPNDDLANWESVYYVGSVLKDAFLDSPFVVVENGSCVGEGSHSFGEDVSLPLDVFVVRHVVVVCGVPCFYAGGCPFG